MVLARCKVRAPAVFTITWQRRGHIKKKRNKSRDATRVEAHQADVGIVSQVLIPRVRGQQWAACGQSLPQAQQGLLL